MGARGETEANIMPICGDFCNIFDDISGQVIVNISNMKVFAEVDISDFLVLKYLCGTAFGNNAPFADDVGFFADIQCFPYIMIGQQYANATHFQVFNDRFDVADRDWIDTCKWLIKQDKARVSCQCPGDFRAPALAAGQTHALVGPDMVNVKLLNQAFHFFPALSFVQILAGFQDCHDIVFHCQVSEDGRVLRQITQSQPGAGEDRQAGQILIIDVDIALVCIDQAYNHVKTGGFASAIGSQKAYDLAAVDGQRHISDHLSAFVGLG